MFDRLFWICCDWPIRTKYLRVSCKTWFHWLFEMLLLLFLQARQTQKPSVLQADPSPSRHRLRWPARDATGDILQISGEETLMSTCRVTVSSRGITPVFSNGEGQNKHEALIQLFLNSLIVLWFRTKFANWLQRQTCSVKMVVIHERMTLESVLCNESVKNVSDSRVSGLILLLKVLKEFLKPSKN